MLELLPKSMKTSYFSPAAKSPFANPDPVYVKKDLPQEDGAADYAEFVLEQEEQYCQQR